MEKVAVIVYIVVNVVVRIVIASIDIPLAIIQAVANGIRYLTIFITDGVDVLSILCTSLVTEAAQAVIVAALVRAGVLAVLLHAPLQRTACFTSQF